MSVYWGGPEVRVKSQNINQGLQLNVPIFILAHFNTKDMEQNSCVQCISCHHTKTTIRKGIPWSILIIWSAVRLSDSDSKHRFGSANARCPIMRIEEISFNIWHILINMVIV